jgi:Carboxypeptidase regulatory-like domain
MASVVVIERFVFTIVLAIAVAAAGFAQPPVRDSPVRTSEPTGTISGRVVASDTGEVLRKARITVNVNGLAAPPVPIGPSGPVPPGRADAVPPVFTDNDGRFVVLNAPIGRVTLSAKKAGYVTTTFGSRRPGMPPIPIDVKDGARTDGVEIRMAKSGAISGRIVDEFGDPAEAITVSAQRLQRQRIDGFTSAMKLGEAVTDDRGAYRIGGLPAGTFLVTASRTTKPQAITLVTRPDGTPRVEGETPQSTVTSYPGVPGISQAQLLDVRAGEERGSVDFGLAMWRPGRLAMTFVDSDGKPTNATAIVASVSESPLRPLLRVMPFMAAQSVTSIEPGVWTVYAHGDGGVGTARVTVGSGDEAVTVMLTRGARISGRVVTDGGALPRGAVVEMTAAFRELGIVAPPVLTPRVRADADGVFELTELAGPCLLHVRISGADGWIPKAIMHNGRNLIDSPINLKSGEELAGVEVVVTNRLAQLKGTVTDGANGLVTDYSALLFPEDRTLTSNPRRLTRWIRPTAAGDFSVDDILPGAYLIAALDDIDDAQWLNDDYLERFRPRATRIELGASETKTIVLQRIDER